MLFLLLVVFKLIFLNNRKQSHKRLLCEWVVQNDMKSLLVQIKYNKINNKIISLEYIWCALNSTPSF